MGPNQLGTYLSGQFAGEKVAMQSRAVAFKVLKELHGVARTCSSTTMTASSRGPQAVVSALRSTFAKSSRLALIIC